MATWAYPCRACSGEDVWFVSRLDLDEVLGPARIVRVKTGNGWRCAVVDRSQPVTVDAMLLREVVASDENDCPECAALLAQVTPEVEAEPLEESEQAESPSADPERTKSAGPAVQAAAISIQDRQMLVVLVGLNVIQSPGEADMLAADLRARFGGVAIVLLGQDVDGTPHYHGDAELVRLLDQVPVDRMPWKKYR